MAVNGDFKETEPKLNRVIVYKGKRGWRWRAFSRNGNNVANSGEDYGHDKGKAVKAALKFGPLDYEVWTQVKGGFEYQDVVSGF